MSSETKLFITGGAGFMGSNFIQYILRKYPLYEVLNFDKLTYAGNLENLRDIESDPRYRFVKGDIADEKAVARAVEAFRPDVIINYAAETHVDRSIQSPKDFLVTDVMGTYTLLEAVREFSVPKFIQISTDEVYGGAQDRSTEETRFDPSSPYSAAKAGGDHMVMAYWKTFKTPVIRTHSCNFFGPYQYPEKLIPLFITNLLERKKVPLYRGGEHNVRNFIYTEDHCRAIDLIFHAGVLGEAYNISTGEEIENIAVARKILAAFGAGEYMIEFVPDRPGHDRRYSLDNSKLKKLGWAPVWSFDTALAETIRWYREHEAWWKPLKQGRNFKEHYEKQYQLEG
ncbi:dTDP-glucose 4,6-dehydratase [Candidatus Uhrbacteria bacterium RIFCSPHIGHO2_12_FULL_54_23]|uniref:dTDP-glucose 4,6-dehydratase n=1 Tax=Candidatus Uhrbacteria bacterium RIFCSPHIGHO2_12_FULL_54_23 TaxID=1802397 RepID=A0A1F7UFU4_9BACT|nr:MAG: dTDP-glucose 4,6-dehydratase [Candidatus Uhrbacteria bacterium RIFCSPHIGHO2_12_FULL_54_23]